MIKTAIVALLYSLLTPGLTPQSLPMGSLPHSSGGGGIANFGGCQDVQTSVTSGSCTVTGVPSGAFAFIVFDNTNTATATVTVTSNTVTERSGDPFVQTSASGEQDQVWTSKNMTAGTLVFGYTMSSASLFSAFTVMVITGTNPSTPIMAQTGTASAASITSFSAPFTCGNITTTASNAFILGVANMNGSGTLTPGTSPQAMTVDKGTGTNKMSEWGTAVTTGSNTVGFGFNNGASGMCEVMAVQ